MEAEGLRRSRESLGLDTLQCGGKISPQLGSPFLGIFSITFPKMPVSWAGGASQHWGWEENGEGPC